MVWRRGVGVVCGENKMGREGGLVEMVDGEGDR